MELQRHPANPILLPDRSSDWECANVFNPGVLYHNGLFHMFYRAQGLDWVSRIGYAVSPDGARWNRLRRPVLEPHDGSDSRGVEDPRVVASEVSDDTVDYVLARFQPDEREVLRLVLDRSADVLLEWCGGVAVETLMGRHNGWCAADPAADPEVGRPGDPQT